MLLIALFTLAVNLYVQSSGVQLKICQALSDAIQMPVSVFRTTYTPWGGFTLSQIEIRGTKNNSGANRTPFLTAANLQIHCQTLPLLAGDFVINRITVNHPVLTWQQNADGDWEWPANPKQSEQAQTPVVEATPQPVPKIATRPTTPSPTASSTPPLTPVESATESTAPPPQKPPVTVHKIAVYEGTLLFIDNDGREIALLDNLRLTVDEDPTPGNFVGKLWIQRILLRERYEIADFNSPVSVSNDSIDIPKIAGAFAGGKIKGSATLQTGKRGTPFALKLKITKASLATICTADPEVASHIQGSVRGDIELTGLGSHSQSNQGTGEFRIENGAFQQYPLLQTIGQILRVDELEMLTLNAARLHLDVSNSLISVQPLEVESQNLRLTATGTVAPDHKLDLGARLFINEKTWKRLPSEARENFVPVPASKERALDFNVRGDLGQPQTDLLKRLIGDKLQKRVRNFLGNWLEERRNDPPAEPSGSTPRATPSKSTP